jgi:hypothetical protein
MADTYRDYGDFDVGDRLRVRATFRNPDDLSYVDPDAVTCTVWHEGDTSPVSVAAVHDSTGRFAAFFIPSVPGRHFMEVKALGEYAVVLKGTFRARGSVIPA